MKYPDGHLGERCNYCMGETTLYPSAILRLLSHAALPLCPARDLLYIFKRRSRLVGLDCRKCCHTTFTDRAFRVFTFTPAVCAHILILPRHNTPLSEWINSSRFARSLKEGGAFAYPMRETVRAFNMSEDDSTTVTIVLEKDDVSNMKMASTLYSRKLVGKRVDKAPIQDSSKDVGSQLHFCFGLTEGGGWLAVLAVLLGPLD